MGILLVAAGLVGIAGGVFGKKFYEADILICLRRKSEKFDMVRAVNFHHSWHGAHSCGNQTAYERIGHLKDPPLEPVINFVPVTPMESAQLSPSD